MIFILTVQCYSLYRTDVK